jgi:hypothetical protein
MTDARDAHVSLPLGNDRPNPVLRAE